MIRCALGLHDHSAAGTDYDSVHRAARQDIKAAVGGNDDIVRRGTGGDLEVAAVDRGAVHQSEGGDRDQTAGDGCVVQNAAGGNADLPAGENRGTVCDAFAINAETASGGNDDAPGDPLVRDREIAGQRHRNAGCGAFLVHIDRAALQRSIVQGPGGFHIHDAAVADQAVSRAAGGDAERTAGVDRVTGNLSVFDLERRSGGNPRDQGVRGDNEIRKRAVE